MGGSVNGRGGGVLQQLQAPGLLEADDPTLGYVMQVWA